MAIPLLQLVLNLTATIAVTSPAFLGCNIDTASLYQGILPHRLDLEDGGLRSLGKAFATAGPIGTTLRVGGSAAEDAVFGPLQPPNRIAVDETYWDQLVTFAGGSGFELAWDLNAFGNSLSMRLPNGEWNSSNAALLLKHVAAHDQTHVLKAVQLGNEPGHYTAETPGAPGPAEHGRDFVALHHLLQQTFPDVTTRPSIQGPDVCFGKYLNCSVVNCTTGGDKCADLNYFETLLTAANGSIDDVTVHHYGLGGPSHGPPYIPHQCTITNLLQPKLWEQDQGNDHPGMLTVLEGV